MYFSKQVLGDGLSFTLRIVVSYKNHCEPSKTEYEVQGATETRYIYVISICIACPVPE